ncbi:hypothetical protein ADUPG1_009556 [Aduncisulcus paluster]|uniref:Nucleolar 27S pre-rRNA processing Urb2/Npa2 C-terminal domain-containing protein n=1 Tax=Aduncisulcus paluster TaxID=2918883 RepID=A0ABQ5KW16_9EUKA|nr:hypothetical protein ADUPG1_009556 [Aduncisulcus paluster]
MSLFYLEGDIAANVPSHMALKLGKKDWIQIASVLLWPSFRPHPAPNLATSIVVTQLNNVIFTIENAKQLFDFCFCLKLFHPDKVVEFENVCSAFGKIPHSWNFLLSILQNEKDSEKIPEFDYDAIIQLFEDYLQSLASNDIKYAFLQTFIPLLLSSASSSTQVNIFLQFYGVIALIAKNILKSAHIDSSKKKKTDPKSFNTICSCLSQSLDLGDKLGLQTHLSSFISSFIQRKSILLSPSMSHSLLKDVFHWPDISTTSLCLNQAEFDEENDILKQIQSLKAVGKKIKKIKRKLDVPSIAKEYTDDLVSHFLKNLKIESKDTTGMKETTSSAFISKCLSLLFASLETGISRGLTLGGITTDMELSRTHSSQILIETMISSHKSIDISKFSSILCQYDPSVPKMMSPLFEKLPPLKSIQLLPILITHMGYDALEISSSVLSRLEFLPLSFPQNTIVQYDTKFRDINVDILSICHQFISDLSGLSIPAIRTEEYISFLNKYIEQSLFETTNTLRLLVSFSFVAIVYERCISSMNKGISRNKNEIEASELLLKTWESVLNKIYLWNRPEKVSSKSEKKENVVWLIQNNFSIDISILYLFAYSCLLRVCGVDISVSSLVPNQGQILVLFLSQCSQVSYSIQKYIKGLKIDEKRGIESGIYLQTIFLSSFCFLFGSIGICLFLRLCINLDLDPSDIIFPNISGLQSLLSAFRSIKKETFDTKNYNIFSLALPLLVSSQIYSQNMHYYPILTQAFSHLIASCQIYPFSSISTPIVNKEENKEEEEEEEVEQESSVRCGISCEDERGKMFVQLCDAFVSPKQGIFLSFLEEYSCSILPKNYIQFLLSLNLFLESLHFSSKEVKHPELNYSNAIVFIGQRCVQLVLKCFAFASSKTGTRGFVCVLCDSLCCTCREIICGSKFRSKDIESYSSSVIQSKIESSLSVLKRFSDNVFPNIISSLRSSSVLIAQEMLEKLYLFGNELIPSLVNLIYKRAKQVEKEKKRKNGMETKKKRSSLILVSDDKTISHQDPKIEIPYSTILMRFLLLAMEKGYHVPASSCSKICSIFSDEQLRFIFRRAFKYLQVEIRDHQKGHGQAGDLNYLEKNSIFMRYYVLFLSISEAHEKEYLFMKQFKTSDKEGDKEARKKEKSGKRRTSSMNDENYSTDFRIIPVSNISSFLMKLLNSTISSFSLPFVLELFSDILSEISPFLSKPLIERLAQFGVSEMLRSKYTSLSLSKEPDYSSSLFHLISIIGIGSKNGVKGSILLLVCSNVFECIICQVWIVNDVSITIKKALYKLSQTISSIYRREKHSHHESELLHPAQTLLRVYALNVHKLPSQCVDYALKCVFKIIPLFKPKHIQRIMVDVGTSYQKIVENCMKEYKRRKILEFNA